MLALRIIICILAYTLCTTAETVFVSDINELAVYASKDGSRIKVKPGIYLMSNYLTDELIEYKHSAAIEKARSKGVKRGDVYMFAFDGNDNQFDFTGVTFKVDTKFLSAFKNCYVREFLISGDRNTFKGLTITDIGDSPTYMGGNSISIQGDDNTFENITVNVRGSFPYGYGDYLGKGGGSLVSLKKHSGIQITGLNTTLIGCKVFMCSFGHAYYVQGGVNTVFENCYAKGEVRSTVDMLAETSGPAFDKNFASVYTNLDGEKKIPAGYMKSLCECGFRTYASGGEDNRLTGKVTLKDCLAENVRVGFALHANEQTESVYIENCEAIGCERGFYLNKAVVKKSRSDALYGPMLYLVGDEASDIELTLTKADSIFQVNALATVCGKSHKIVLIQDDSIHNHRRLPILLGYGMPSSGEISSPIPEDDAFMITLTNKTYMPVEIGSKAHSCRVQTLGEVRRNDGKDIKIEKLR